jgi:hypothetical protein
MSQITLGALEKGEEPALGILQGWPHRDSFPPKAGCGDGHCETLRSHAVGREVSEAGIDELASREAQRLKARRPKAVTDPAGRGATPGHSPPILGEHGLGATAAPHAAVPSKRFANVVREVHAPNILRG